MKSEWGASLESSSTRLLFHCETGEITLMNLKVSSRESCASRSCSNKSSVYKLVYIVRGSLVCLLLCCLSCCSCECFNKDGNERKERPRSPKSLESKHEPVTYHWIEEDECKADGFMGSRAAPLVVGYRIFPHITVICKHPVWKQKFLLIGP